MVFDPAIHHRRSIRLRGYDYSSPELYFVTLCTQNKALLFGEIVHGHALLNDVGRLMELHWKRLPRRFPGVLLDHFVVMPNHFHALVGLTRLAEAGTAGTDAPNPAGAGADGTADTGSAPTGGLILPSCPA